MNAVRAFVILLLMVVPNVPSLKQWRVLTFSCAWSIGSRRRASRVVDVLPRWDSGMRSFWSRDSSSLTCGSLRRISDRRSRFMARLLFCQLCSLNPKPKPGGPRGGALLGAPRQSNVLTGAGRHFPHCSLWAAGACAGTSPCCGSRWRGTACRSCSLCRASRRSATAARWGRCQPPPRKSGCVAAALHAAAQMDMVVWAAESGLRAPRFQRGGRLIDRLVGLGRRNRAQRQLGLGTPAFQIRPARLGACAMQQMISRLVESGQIWEHLVASCPVLHLT